MRRLRRRLVVLLVAMLAGCATKEPRAPLLHVKADSEETARGVARAVESAGVPVKLVAVKNLKPAEIPEWVNAEEGGWVLFGKAKDREAAEKALDAWYAELRAASPSPPPEPEAFRLGTRHSLAPDEVTAIQAELERRRVLDQAVRTDPRRRDRMATVDADNTAYLRRIVADIGWIDAERFGPAAAGAAFLLVQHSGDLPLMSAALPEIEKRVRPGSADAQSFALLYDRTQLMRGGKQRYGTQVREMETGELVVSRLEDPDRVDERRAALGLMPLRQYLGGFGGDVRIER
jgi:hypothetical protein